MKINVLLDWGNWNTWLGILLFFVGLGILVTIHELGHFIAAKSFKVYCSDFSIGFGKKIVKIKRKKAETTFSIGIVPLGGYVAMYEGSEDDDPEMVNVPKSRSISGIARWKRFIIFGAGIVMNFILGYFIFFIGCSCFPHYETWGTVVEYNKKEYSDDNSKLLLFDEEGNAIEDHNILSVTNVKDSDLTDGSYYTLETRNIKYKYKDKEISFNAFVQAKDASNPNDFEILPYNLEYNENTLNYVISLNTSNFAINNNDYSSYVEFIKSEKASGTDFSEVQFYGLNNDKYEYINYEGNLDNLYLPILDEDNKANKLKFDEMYNDRITGDKLISFRSSNEDKLIYATLVPHFKGSKLASFNLKMYQYKYWLGLNSFKEAGDLWVRSTTAIFEAIGNLFIGRGWENVGGPVAILNATTTQLISNPFYIYLYNWAMISVNLAIFNLLPFPGLDGWQILVEIIEGIINSIKKAKYKKQHKNELVLETNVISTTEGEEVNVTKENVSISIGEEVKNEYKEWKIPAKVKGIVSYIGLGLLFLLAIVIFVFDIIRMF